MFAFGLDDGGVTAACWGCQRGGFGTCPGKISLSLTATKDGDNYQVQYQFGMVMRGELATAIGSASPETLKKLQFDFTLADDLIGTMPNGVFLEAWLQGEYSFRFTGNSVFDFVSGKKAGKELILTYSGENEYYTYHSDGFQRVISESEYNALFQ